MSLDLHKVRQRLALVEPTLLSPSSIKSEQATGARLGSKNQASGFAAGLLPLARRNPVLAASRAMGAWDGTGCPAAQAQAQLGLAVALVWWGYHAEALSLLRDDSPPTDTLVDDDPDTLIRAWHSIACERHLQKTEGSFNRLITIAELLDQAGYAQHALRCRIDALNGISMAGASPAQIALLAEVSAACQRERLEEELGIVLTLETTYHFFRGRLDQARRTLAESEDLFTRLHMPAMLAFVWIRRAAYFIDHRQYPEAVHWLNKAYQQAKGLQHALYQARARMEMGNNAYLHGHITESLEHYRACHVLGTQLAHRYILASSELGIANAHLHSMEYDQAAAGYTRAHAIYDDLGYADHSMIATQNLAIVAQRQGQFGRALRLMHDVLTRAEQDRAYEQWSNAHYYLGTTYAAFAYFEPALDHMRRAIEIRAKAGVSLQTIPLTLSIARILIVLGDLSQARTLVEQAAELHGTAEHPSQDDVTMGQLLGVLALSAGDPDGALLHFRAARKIALLLGLEEEGQGLTIDIAEALLAENRSTAAYSQLRALDATRLPAALSWRLRAVEARIAQQEGDIHKALEGYDAALLLLRDARRSLPYEEQAARFVRANQSVFDTAFSLATRLQDNEHALALAEAHSAQLLNARLGRTLGVQSPQRSLWDSTSETLGQQLSESLGDAWSVLRYVWNRDGLRLFTLSPAGLYSYPLPLSAEDDLALRACASPHNSFRRHAYHEGPVKPLSHQYRHTLLDRLIPPPILERLAPDHTLIVVPSWRLFGLPFQALLSANKPLITQTQILYAHSLNQLNYSLAHTEPAQQVNHGMVFAQAQFSQSGYPPLPHAISEQQVVSRLMPGQAARLTPEDLLAGDAGAHLERYTWMHFSTHTHIDPETGAFTGLLVGDEVLGLERIARWRLHAAVVTLSACQTGLGRWYYGDEIAGLTESFLATGAKTVIASLWITLDKQAVDFMRTLYSHLAGGYAPLAALAVTQRQAHEEGIPAYYWAPYSAFGRP